jgi:hypothetical protein
VLVSDYGIRADGLHISDYIVIRDAMLETPSSASHMKFSYIVIQYKRLNSMSSVFRGITNQGKK